MDTLPPPAPAPLSPDNLPPPTNKRAVWPWVLGGVVCVVVGCLGIAALGTFMMMRAVDSRAQRVSEVFAQINSGLSAPSVGGSGASESYFNEPIYDENADAEADIAQALAQAQREGKRVLIDFGADWCLDCVVLDKHFNDPKVKPFLDEHFVVVRVNVGEWDTNLAISERYGDPIVNGIPAIVVLTADKKVIASTGGGELANARTADQSEILALLKQWAGPR